MPLTRPPPPLMPLTRPPPPLMPLTTPPPPLMPLTKPPPPLMPLTTPPPPLMPLTTPPPPRIAQNSPPAHCITLATSTQLPPPSIASTPLLLSQMEPAVIFEHNDVRKHVLLPRLTAHTVSPHVRPGNSASLSRAPAPHARWRPSPGHHTRRAEGQHSPRREESV